MIGARSSGVVAAAVAAAALACPAPAAGQSVLERTPNLSGGWVGLPSTLNLGLLHRFVPGEDSDDGVDDAPTFFVGWGHGGYSLIAVRYTTVSDLVPGDRDADEWEVLARFSPLSTEIGATVGLGLTAAWNEAAGSFDGELTAVVPAGPVRVVGALRGFSDAFGSEEARWAFGVGTILDLTGGLALAADVARPFGLEEGEAIGWGAGLQIAVPGTPVTLSLQGANTRSGTLQGSSRRYTGTRWGFEVAVPLRPARYFGGEASLADPSARAGQADLVAGDTLRISLGDAGWAGDPVTVAAGTYVLWSNEGEEIHTVTSEARGWQSPFMAPGESFGRVFSEPGEHAYRCTFHPTERATLVVAPSGGG